MSARDDYNPGPAEGRLASKEGDHWTLVLVRELRHSPDKVWQALTDPEQLREWAPFDADRSLGTTGTNVMLTTANMPSPHAVQTTVTRAEAPKLLEYPWGDGNLRWELEPTAVGTRLTLWASIDRRYISWGAAGWHICIDVLDRSLGDEPLGRIVGPDAMKFGDWKRLNKEYAEQFGVDPAGGQ